MLTLRSVHAEVTVRLATIIAAFVLFVTPLASDAQQVATVARVGVLLHHGTPPGFLEAFRAGLQDLGISKGRTSRSNCGMPKARTTDLPRWPMNSCGSGST
jgi:hypothetical protein